MTRTRHGASRFSRRPTKNLDIGPVLMKQILKRVFRHLLGAIAAGGAAWLTSESGVEVKPEAIMTIGLATYAAVEKGLKVVTKETD